ncbi:hypothetical protein LSM04_006210 [Trypanosoma melophagium]|uniref:uncharacterized protein n=1 Tax=Trypanosoma melophagium TaxID=715481 RepID=UPI003519E0EE|nr:hypothetical protein LSM04_006210 [Trypanosoma melophagium]
MQSPSVAPSGDSAENIYSLLCAVQTQANADAEEMKSLRLCIANAEEDVVKTREEIRQLSQQHEKAKEEMSIRRLALEEQKIRHAGVMEVLQNTRKELTQVADTVMNCDLPIHTVAPQASLEPLAPVKLRDAVQSLRQKIEMASQKQQQEKRHIQMRQDASIVAHERSSPIESYGDNNTNNSDDDDDDNNDNSNGAARSFTVRFRREETSAAGDEIMRSSINGSDDDRKFFPSKQRRRKTITFNDSRLEVRSDVSRVTAVNNNVATSEKDSSAPAAALAAVSIPTSSATFAAPNPSACHTLFNGLRAPRKTLWRTDALPEK